MSSNDLDLGILCPRAGKALIEKDPNFIIYGDLIKNGEGILYKKKGEVKKLAFGNGRIEQLEIIYNIFGRNIWITSGAVNTLPYLLEKKEVDGIVTDYGRYEKLKDKYKYILPKKDFVSHVLVINKKFLRDKRFIKFIKNYNDYVEEIKNGERDKWMPIYIPLKLEE